MELYVCGFNAFNQLDFSSQTPVEEPDDVFEFRHVLSDEKIEIVHASWSATILRTSSGLKVAGMLGQDLKCWDTDAAGGTLLVVAGNGKILSRSPTKSSYTFKTDCSTLEEYSSVNSYPTEPSQTFPELGDASYVAAGQTHFAALCGGAVWTWGDIRHSPCLGREVDGDANYPAAVTDLSDLPTGPIVKIAAGGYASAALTAGCDLYFWGTAWDLTAEPAPLDLDGEDFLDVGLGDEHGIVLTADRKVYVRGVGRNGQLGMVVESLGEWTELDVKLPAKREVVGVVAGPKCSFLIVRVTP